MGTICQIYTTRGMGHLVNGVWRDDPPAPNRNGGEFKRVDSRFRDRITADGSSGFPAAARRYHLFVADSCPWAHRTVIVRMLKRLEGSVSISAAGAARSSQGWEYTDGPANIVGNGSFYLHQVYTAARPDYSGRVTVPTLWDLETRTIVNNESSEIIRMLNSEFDHIGDGSGDRHVDLYPEPLRPEIDAVNTLVYEYINNGVYRCGFASTQEAYEQAFDALFSALDEIESRLGRSRYLVGARLTEADWRLFPTLVRFDAVYFGHFKCNLKRIADYPNLSNYLRQLYQMPGIAATVNMDVIKRQYYGTHKGINPTGIVPKGPELDLSRPHNRGGH